MRALYLILLLLWLVVAYFICNKLICHKAETKISSTIDSTSESYKDCSAKLILRDTATHLNLLSEENFRFRFSKYTFLHLSSEFNVLLSSVVTHLGENPNTLMQIKGYYLPTETNSTKYSNLGIARANMVKTFFLEQGVNSDQLRTIGKQGNPNCLEDSILQKGVAIAFGVHK